MKTSLVVVVAAAGASLLGGDSDAQPKPITLYDKFAIQGMKLGMNADGNTGFTCVMKPPAGAQAGELVDTHCVKFTDPRCAGKPASVGALRYGEDPPLGCFLDHSSFGTYLDQTLQQTPNTGDRSDARQANPKKPLANVHLIGTATKPSKIWRIVYTTAPDDLAEGSKLYEAMVAKYGQPTSKSPPNRARWRVDNLNLDAQCSPPRNCEITLEDTKLRSVEEKRYQETLQRGQRQNAPTPEL